MKGLKAPPPKEKGRGSADTHVGSWGFVESQGCMAKRRRQLLCENRLPWDRFESAVASLADDPPAAARAFLERA